MHENFFIDPKLLDANTFFKYSYTKLNFMPKMGVALPRPLRLTEYVWQVFK